MYLYLYNSYSAYKWILISWYNFKIHFIIVFAAALPLSLSLASLVDSNNSCSSCHFWAKQMKTPTRCFEWRPHWMHGHTSCLACTCASVVVTVFVFWRPLLTRLFAWCHALVWVIGKQLIGCIHKPLAVGESNKVKQLQYVFAVRNWSTFIMFWQMLNICSWVAYRQTYIHNMLNGLK